jgi:beta-glucosidase-like glycosyl hydrolase/CubicO group peptidase (beta-lactamase class C family)
MKHFVLSIIITSFFYSSVFAQKTTVEDRWVDSMYQTLNDTQRIGQMIMIRAHSNLGYDHISEVEYLIKKYHIGSLCFFQGTPEKQLELTNRYQKISEIPLFVAMDAEWGLNMRLKSSTIAYPKQIMLGAITDNHLIYRFGEAIAKECRRLGVHINFAPSIDINVNRNNPIINERSFGDNMYNVAAKGFEYAKGMQDNNVMACAKHFPGHGDTDVDSHLDLPVVNHDMARLSALELMPFRALSQHGVASMMVGHLSIPSIDNTWHVPTSLSKNAVRELLRNQIGFNGLIFTDGLEMRGVTRYFHNGEASAKAIEAGCDILCLPESTPEAFNAIKRYISEGRIDTNDIEASVKRILHAKFRYGLTTPQYIEPANIRWDINSAESKELKSELLKNALTLARNDDRIVPFTAFQPDSIAVLAIGSESWTPFQIQLNNAGLTGQFNVSKYFSAQKQAQMLDYFSKKKTVIVSLHGLRVKASENFGVTQITREFVNELAQKTKVVLVVFGNPYILKDFDGVDNVLECYNEEKETQEFAAQGLLGTFEFKGKLPVTASEKSKNGFGFLTTPIPNPASTPTPNLPSNVLPKKMNRLEWNTATPETAGVDAKTLNTIDTIAKELIAARAAPGCQILVARNGQIVYHKAFGYHTYEKIHPITTDDLYDLASITKCAATTVCLMKLHDEGKIDLNKTLGDYLPYLQGSNKANLSLRDVLIHQAGLPAWIPFYKQTLDSAIIDGKKKFFPSEKYYAKTAMGDFTVPVTPNLFMRKDYVDTMKMRIANIPLRDNRSYLYSDLGLILLADIIKNITGKTLDVYATESFYGPLSMNRTLFNPLTKFPEMACAPTEEDNYFRMNRVRGTVHDMAAAMLGGVSGHAGLFSTTSDLAILLEMLLNQGEYNGVSYIKPETVQFFTSRQGGSTRRGIGWDMKELNPSKTLNMSKLASDATYGHTGFTGNAAYVDPEKNLVYIFLSNRTYPDSGNNKLINGNYRTRIQNVVYEAMR